MNRNVDMIKTIEMSKLQRGLIVPIALLVLFGIEMKAQTMNDLSDSASYAIGMNSGSGLKQLMESDSVKINVDLLLEGLRAAVEGKETRFSDSVSQQVLIAFQAELTRITSERSARQGAGNVEKGNAFLAENRSKEGVVETESGLQYMIIESGSGESPDSDDVVSVEYRGMLIDGTEFDASRPGNPVTFPVNGVIAGWTESLQLMKPGSTWKLFIPAGLAYGERGAPPRIGPNEVLIFEVKLLSVEKK